MRHGGQILVDQLAIHGCDTAFCVPGESYLAALDGLHAHNRIQTITCRQEGGAAMMADAYAKMTGKPGICFVTRGPGASNAASGIHVARQDSSPLILFVGQVGQNAMEREAFQEIDYRRMFGNCQMGGSNRRHPSNPGIRGTCLAYVTRWTPGPCRPGAARECLERASGS